MSYVLYFLLLLFNLKVTSDLDQFTTVNHSICCYVLFIKGPWREFCFSPWWRRMWWTNDDTIEKRWGKRVHWYVLCSSLFLLYYFLYKWCLFIILNAFSLLYLWQDDGHVGSLTELHVKLWTFACITFSCKTDCYTVDIRIVNVLSKWFHCLSSHIFNTLKIVLLSGRDRSRKIIHLIQRYICPAGRFQILYTVSFTLLSSRTGW